MGKVALKRWDVDRSWAVFQKTFWLLGLVAFGPAYRSLSDKLWMLRGNLETVGYWAQIQGLSELVFAPAQAGIGVGLTIMAARPDERRTAPLVLGASLLGGLTALPLMLGLGLRADWLRQEVGLPSDLNSLVELGLVNGGLSIPMLLLVAYWAGTGQRKAALLLLVSFSSPTCLILAFDQTEGLKGLQHVLFAGTLTSLLVNAGLLVLGCLAIARGEISGASVRDAVKRLSPYLMAGLTIGLASPTSGLLIRKALALMSSWEMAGAVTALWRISDWIFGCASGILFNFYLPRLAARFAGGTLLDPLGQMLRAVWLPSVFILGLAIVFREPLYDALYSDSLRVGLVPAALFWGGDAMRILSTIGLIGLFSLEAGTLISVGEFLSQPLLAGLFWMGAARSLESAGAAHLLTYCIYAGFNGYGLVWVSRRRGRNASSARD